MDDNIEDASSKRVAWLHSKHYSAAGDIFGEPQKTARIGDEYQAQIPSFMTGNERLQLIALPACDDVKTDVQNYYEFGLPIPVTWVHNQPKNKKDTLKIQASIQESAEGKFGVLGSGTDNHLVPVPCSSSEESWSEIEYDSFLLGLYIFGKNLLVVNKLLGNKGMTDVLSYYYGTFYRSRQHKKWSKYRKKRSNKSVPGKNIFKGWRRQELLSRLLPNITDECKSHLTQVISTFDEGKLTFEKYFFTLRDTVGINLLVEAVAIGKETQDLTMLTKRRLRGKMFHTNWSSLKTQEINDILKDRIGLSKVKLNEIFWDGVWPRLLARGWHSEQTTNYALQNTKKSLVFLAPGVAKFSRRGLEKGTQYFDSYTEVLNKVALEPQLLEQEPNQGELVGPQGKQGSEDKQDLMKCTIVDTSLVGHIKVGEITSLPVFHPADNDMLASSSVSGETEKETTKESQYKYMHHNSAEDSPVSETSTVKKEMNLCTNGQTVKKLKFTFKTKAKRLRANTTKSENLSGEHKLMEDVNHRNDEDSPDCEASTVNKKMDLCSTNGQPLRKLKLTFKPKAKRHWDNTTRNHNLNGEHELMEDQRSEKKRSSIVIDLNNPLMGPVSGADNSLSSSKPSVFTEKTTNQPELSAAGANSQIRQSTRNRPLTTKALEALANGYLNPKRKSRDLEDGAHRRVRPKTALVSRCASRYNQNMVDGAFNGSSHMVSESPK